MYGEPNKEWEIDLFVRLKVCTKESWKEAKLTILEAFDAFVEDDFQPLCPRTHECTNEPHVCAHERFFCRCPGDGKNRFYEWFMGLIEFRNDRRQGVEPSSKLSERSSGRLCRGRGVLGYRE